jgi:hypothetical protein
MRLLRRKWVKLLLGLAAFYVIVFITRWASAYVPYEPTGDALYDAYARFLLHQMAAASWNATPPGVLEFDYMMSWQQASVPVWLDDLIHIPPVTAEPRRLKCEEVLGWKEQFGTDPRYWQLRVALELDKPYDLELEEAAPIVPGKLVLDCRAGQGDEGSFASLPLDRIYSNDEDLALELTDKAIEQFGDNSYWHYKKGFAEMGLGEADDALREFELGNAAPRNVWPQPFPISTLYDHRYAKSQVLGNRVIRGVIAQQDEANLPNYIKVKERYKEACIMLAMGYDPRLGDEMIKAAGRMGQMQRIPPPSQAVAAVMARVLAGYVKDDLLSEPYASDKQLKELADFGTQIRNGMTALGITSLRQAKYKTPFIKVMYHLQGSSSQPNSVPFSSSQSQTGLPALQREDWLNFEYIWRLDQVELRKNAGLFDALQNPPLARIFAVAAKADLAAHESPAGQ